jgi:serine/threonine protein kinase
LFGKPYSYNIDTWSLGVIVYELICGYYPFPAKNFGDLVHKVCNERFAPLPYHISPELKDLIEALLIKDQMKRPSIQ